MTVGTRPVVSALLYADDGTPIAYKSGGELATISRGTDPDLVNGVRDSYVTTSSTTITRLRSSFWTDPVDEGQRSIKSTSTLDVGGQSGIWAVRVTYYRNDGTGPFTEDITLLGQTAVATVATDIRFIERIEALTSGTNEVAEGNIDLVSGNDGTGDSLGRINLGESSTKWAQHWIPPGGTMHLVSMYGGSRSTGGAGTGSNGRIFLRKHSLLTTRAAPIDVFSGFRIAQDESTVMISPSTPIQIAGPSLVSLWVRADGAAGTEWFAGFNFYES
jgi:hypothetical protein